MAAAHQATSSGEAATQTQVGNLPAECLAEVIALTSPRDASRCAAVSPAFRAAADSDHVWRRFIPKHLLATPRTASAKSSKEAYLGLCDAAGGGDDGGGCRVWLDRATGAACYALSARRLSLPWDDGEFSWRFTTHPLSRFAEVAELLDCTSLDIYGSLPAAALTPATPYAAYFIYGTAEGGHRGLSYPDQETAVAVGGCVVARHAVCLLPDDEAARKFVRAVVAAGAEGPPPPTARQPRIRKDGWWEMEMGRLIVAGEEEKVVASFEVLGWYPKRGLVIEGIEFRPVVHSSAT